MIMEMNPKQIIDKQYGESIKNIIPENKITMLNEYLSFNSFSILNY